MKINISIIFIAGGIFAVIWFLSAGLSGAKNDIISRQGIHWHADLSIKISDEYQNIPANIGIGAVHQPIHTHESDGIIHMELSGLVRKNDIKLGRFFNIWEKKFSKDCIFDKCSGEEGKLKMLVNGKENFEFENYAMQDKDKIEIIFEGEENVTEAIKEITVVGTEFSFSPSAITVQAGEKVKLTFKNEGRAPHNLVIEGLEISTKTISGGQTDTVEFTAPASGTYTIFCSVPGHKSSGMEGSLKVE